jgi:sodium transport system ATP-binding protein
MIAGLLRPDAGRVRIDGIDVASARVAALERIGVLHDEFGLYPRLTAREHLRFAAELHGLRGSARDAAVARAVERLEIGSLADRRAKGFSHGQRMKVALARALVRSPRNLIRASSKPTPNPTLIRSVDSVQPSLPPRPKPATWL